MQPTRLSLQVWIPQRRERGYGSGEGGNGVRGYGSGEGVTDKGGMGVGMEGGIGNKDGGKEMGGGGGGGL